MFLRRSAAVKYFIAAYIGAALYCEWFVYYMQPAYWPALTCEDEAACTRILLIADPQIQGDLAVPPPLNYLFNWDSDRYLRSTFTVVTGHWKPDVLVYLGDLMDEGSVASIPQFHNYAKRLFGIFELDYPVMQVWLPGDNDIGGENEPIKRDKVAEFEKIFNQPAVLTHRNISFYKVNGITHEYPKVEDGDGDYRIVVSHYSVTIRDVFGRQVNDEIHPNIYFCAHGHDSKYVTLDGELGKRVTHHLDPAQVLTVGAQDGDSLCEVHVPTCSYRMGTDNIGYGAAVFDHKTKELRYAVLWSPRRFPYLFFYGVILVIAVLYCLIFCAAKLKRQPQAWSNDKVPLLT